jgi:hypothetical protein
MLVTTRANGGPFYCNIRGASGAGCSVQLDGDGVKVNLLKTVLLSFQHSPIEIIKFGIDPIIWIFDPEKGTDRRLHWVMLIPGGRE